MNRPTVGALLAAVLLLVILVPAIHAQQPDSASNRRMELMQEKQITLQELTLVITERQDLQQQDRDAQQQQRQLGSQPPGTVYYNVLWFQQKQALIDQRNAIAAAYRENLKREAELRNKLNSLDNQIRGL
jgi:hypothetical protein